MGLFETFRLTFGTRDFKYIIGTVPQESGRVVTLFVNERGKQIFVMENYKFNELMNELGVQIP